MQKRKNFPVRCIFLIFYMYKNKYIKKLLRRQCVRISIFFFFLLSVIFIIIIYGYFVTIVFNCYDLIALYYKHIFARKIN